MSFHSHSPRRWHVAFVLGVLGVGVWNNSAAAQQKEHGTRASKVEYEGWRQYMTNCARCHGDDAVGGVIAPDLRASVTKGAIDEASFESVVNAGRSGKGMPPFKGTLRKEQITAIYAYVDARAKGRLPTGRPS
jgi:cytochrome c